MHLKKYSRGGSDVFSRLGRTGKTGPWLAQSHSRLGLELWFLAPTVGPSPLCHQAQLAVKAEELNP